MGILREGLGNMDKSGSGNRSGSDGDEDQRLLGTHSLFLTLCLSLSLCFCLLLSLPLFSFSALFLLNSVSLFPSFLFFFPSPPAFLPPSFSPCVSKYYQLAFIKRVLYSGHCSKLFSYICVHYLAPSSHGPGGRGHLWIFQSLSLRDLVCV